MYAGEVGIGRDTSRKKPRGTIRFLIAKGQSPGQNTWRQAHVTWFKYHSLVCLVRYRMLHRSLWPERSAAYLHHQVVLLG